MGGMKISELDFVRLLPAFMRDDEAVIALSKAMNRLMGEPGKRLSTIRTWDKIDELNEAECDAMAWELDIDWYDSVGMTLEEKRATIKVAQQIKRKRGTKWAVERLISAYFGVGYVVEWYEWDMAPFTFMVLTTNAHITPENYDKFVKAANAAKNERSHIVGVFYFWEQDTGIEYALGTGLHRYDFEKCGTRHKTATIGFVSRSSIETEPAVSPVLYHFPEKGVVRGAITGSAIVGSSVIAKSNFVKCGTYPQPGTIFTAQRKEKYCKAVFFSVIMQKTEKVTKRGGIDL